MAGQYAANARVLEPLVGRTDFVPTVAERWLQLDATRFPLVHRVAKQLPRHDDRVQFLGGIDLVLAGMQA